MANADESDAERIGSLIVLSTFSRIVSLFAQILPMQNAIAWFVLSLLFDSSEHLSMSLRTAPVIFSVDVTAAHERNSAHSESAFFGRISFESDSRSVSTVSSYMSTD